MNAEYNLFYTWDGVECCLSYNTEALGDILATIVLKDALDSNPLRGVLVLRTFEIRDQQFNKRYPVLYDYFDQMYVYALSGITKSERRLSKKGYLKSLLSHLEEPPLISGKYHRLMFETNVFSTPWMDYSPVCHTPSGNELNLVRQDVNKV